MLTQALQFLRDLCLPVVVVRREGFMLGWVEIKQGIRFAHCEKMFLRPKYRSSHGAPDVHKLDLHAAYVRACARRGINVLVTRVSKKREKLQDMICRLGGYRRYGEDISCVWFLLDMRSTEAREQLAARHSEARLAAAWRAASELPNT